MSQDEGSNALKMLAVKPTGNIPLERPRRRGVVNIRKYF